MIKQMFFTALLLFGMFQAYSKVKYMKVDLLNIVLVSENGHLINDSTECAVMKGYFMDALHDNNMGKLDTIIKIVIANKEFFIGMNEKEIRSLIGFWGGSSDADHLSYKWQRPDLEGPPAKVLLFFRFIDLKVVYVEAPYSYYCCNITPEKNKWSSKRYMKHAPAIFPPGRYGY